MTLPPATDHPTHPRREPRRSTHIPALDGVRGLAILLVLVFHFVSGAYEPGATGVRRAVQAITGAGWVGVDLFFVLSGFLITSILYEARGSEGYFKNFYMRRVLRIFPLYYGVLILGLVVLPMLGQNGNVRAIVPPQVVKQQWALWTYFQNFVSINWGGFTHFWSLAVEEHFYLVWPAVVFLLPRRGAMGVCIGLIVAALAIRTARVAWLPHDLETIEETYRWTICRMDALAIGSFVALACRGSATSLASLRKPALWLMGSAAVAVLALIRHKGSLWYGHVGVQTIGFTVIGLGAAGLMITAIVAPGQSLVGRAFRNAGLRFFGKYSYGIYVFHGFLVPWLDRVLPVRSTAAQLGSHYLALAAHVLIGMGLSLVAALVSWHLYEKHFLKLKRFFEYRAATLKAPTEDSVVPPPAPPTPAVALPDKANTSVSQPVTSALPVSR